MSLHGDESRSGVQYPHRIDPSHYRQIPGTPSLHSSILLLNRKERTTSPRGCSPPKGLGQLLQKRGHPPCDDRCGRRCERGSLQTRSLSSNAWITFNHCMCALKLINHRTEYIISRNLRASVGVHELIKSGREQVGALNSTLSTCTLPPLIQLSSNVCMDGWMDG